MSNKIGIENAKPDSVWLEKKPERSPFNPGKLYALNFGKVAVFEKPMKIDHDEKRIFFPRSQDSVVIRPQDMSKYILVCVEVLWEYDELMYTQTVGDIEYYDSLYSDSDYFPFYDGTYYGPATLWLMPDGVIRADNFSLEDKKKYFKLVE